MPPVISSAPIPPSMTSIELFRTCTMSSPGPASMRPHASVVSKWSSPSPSSTSDRRYIAPVLQTATAPVAVHPGPAVSSEPPWSVTLTTYSRLPTTELGVIVYSIVNAFAACGCEKELGVLGTDDRRACRSWCCKSTDDDCRDDSRCPKRAHRSPFPTDFAGRRARLRLDRRAASVSGKTLGVLLSWGTP